jgi:LmbE family N-acetylglucosaminyl deacetylase
MRDPPSRIAVVSPHLDDGVLSLGAFIASATRRGARVLLVTVFAGDPQSTKPAGGWDRRAGFATEGEAVRARRVEDYAACAVLGAEPVWLMHSEADYGERGAESTTRDEILQAVAEMQAILVPGFPLTNPDHAAVSRMLVTRERSVQRVGMYAEQPYRYWSRRQRRLQRGWVRLGTSPESVRLKRQAIREYRSQIPLLGLDRGRPARLDRLLASEVLARGEAIAWLTQ